MSDTGEKKKSKKSIFMRIMDFVVPIVCIGVIVFAGYNLFEIYQSYSEAQSIYDGLALYVDENADDGAEAAAMIEAGFPYMNVDFDALSQVNSDFLGWLYFPLLDISYPVVYGDEDFTYLKMAMDGTPSNSGCIFIDCESDPYLGDMTTIFYGHNMRNGSMFGSLKKVRNEKGLIDNDPYFYYYTPTMAYKCHVFAYYLEKTGGKTYMAPGNAKGYDQYLDYVLGKNEYADGPSNVNLSRRPKLVTLSTCSGHNTGNRTVIQAVIEDTYEIGENTVIGDSFDAENE